MKEISIKTQSEFDNLPSSFEEFTYICIYGEVSVSRNPGNAQVTARENAQVTAGGNAQVTAGGNVCVHNYSSEPVLLFGLAVCFLLNSLAKAIKKSNTPTIIKGLFKDGKTENWLELEGVSILEQKVVLFKRVSSLYKTQENTPNETIWKIGETLTVPNWKPDGQECGVGKFHACSYPYFCDEFRDEKGDKYVAIQVSVKDLFSWPNPSYPHKIAFRKGKVLYECDKYGKELLTTN